MAIIVADNLFLQTAATQVKNSRIQRLKKHLIDVLFSRVKHNRSPFPDRVWVRHSALLNAARMSSTHSTNR